MFKKSGVGSQKSGVLLQNFLFTSSPLHRFTLSPLLDFLHLRHHLLDVFPHERLVPRVPEEVCRMECRHDRYALIRVPFAAKFSDPFRGLQQRLCRDIAEGHDHLRFDRLELLDEKRFARLDLIGLRIPVVRRSALYDIADIHVFPAKLHAFDDDVREELARRYHERPALLVFFVSRPPTDKHERRIRIPLAEDNGLPAVVQLAPGTVTKFLANRGKSFGMSYRKSPLSPLC